MKVDGIVYVVSSDQVRYMLPSAITRHIFRILFQLYHRKPELFTPEDQEFLAELDKHFYSEG